MFDYSPLWETMQRRGVSQYQLLKSGVDNKTLDALKKGRNITMVTLEKLCRIIGCTPNDVIHCPPFPCICKSFPRRPHLFSPAPRP